MRQSFSPLAGLLVSTAVGWVLCAGQASAQTVEAAAGGQPPSADGLLGEVVVTATRQLDTVSRVPLSVTAQTQRTLDQRGVRTVSDLNAVVPALQVTGQASNVQISIRGILSTSGAPTTGVYLDDTPLQKRNVGGLAGPSNNGSPIPPIFDLERIEVLRGPQGTLYGGSSQGGTVRVITPAPSLTRFSSYARTELSQAKDGDPSYEGGLAVGGPIVQDKLGFRLSVFARHQGGFIDYVDAYDGGRMRFENANSGNTRVLRAALVWAPVDNARATLSVYGSRTLENSSGGDSYTLPSNDAIVVRESCYNTTAIRPSSFVTNPAPVACTAPNNFRRAGYTIPALSFLQPYQTTERFVPQSTTSMRIASLTLEYEFPNMTARSISSYIEDVSKNSTWATVFLGNSTLDGMYGATPFRTGLNLNPVLRDYAGNFIGRNARHGTSQELRFSSSGASPLSWVAGVFYSAFYGHSHYDNFEPGEILAAYLYGMTLDQRFGVGRLPNGSTSQRDQTLDDTEIAAFGEANYQITAKLRATAGIRFSRESFKYTQLFSGTVNGNLRPEDVPGGVTNGQVSESPITPKLGLSYQITDNDMVYVSAAKGYRPGGVNSPLSESICGPALRTLGLTIADIPTTFNSDTVWSYEGGAKLRLLDNRLQLNSSAFRIDWTGVQLSITPGAGCGQPWVANAGKARSEGFDVEAEARVLPGLTVGMSAGYTNTRYRETVTAPKPLSGAAPAIIVQDRQPFPIPPWTFAVNVRYDFKVAGRLNTYLRADYRYASTYDRNTVGVPGYTPDTHRGVNTFRTDLRGGMELWEGLEANLFVKNLFNYDAGNRSGGRSGCTVASGASCSVFTTFNPIFTVSTVMPREIGVQLVYRR